MSAIGPAFRREGRGDGFDRGTQSPQHVGNHMVLADEDAVRLHLGREMPVAEMPGNPAEERGIGGDLDDRFWRFLHCDPAAIFEGKPVSRHQHLGAVEIEQKILALVAGELQPAAVAVVEIERDRAPCLVLGPTPGFFDMGDAMHGQKRK